MNQPDAEGCLAVDQPRNEHSLKGGPSRRAPQLDLCGITKSPPRPAACLVDSGWLLSEPLHSQRRLSGFLGCYSDDRLSEAVSELSAS